MLVALSRPSPLDLPKTISPPASRLVCPFNCYSRVCAGIRVLSISPSLPRGSVSRHGGGWGRALLYTRRCCCLAEGKQHGRDVASLSVFPLDSCRICLHDLYAGNEATLFFRVVYRRVGFLSVLVGVQCGSDACMAALRVERMNLCDKERLVFAY